jgi:hypothetical protein
MEGKLYSVICSPPHDWDDEQIVSTGLAFEAAKKLERLLTAAHNALTAQPFVSSWSSFIFYCAMEPVRLRRKSGKRHR